MIAVQSDIAALKVGLEDIVIPDPVDVNPIQQSMTVIPYDSSSQTVLLPLNVRIVSILVVNLSMTPTEELGYSCHTITSNVTNTIANVQFIGIHSSDPFQLEINYINITP